MSRTVFSTALRQSLSASLVPMLRDWGFRGSWPHYRRSRGDRVDLISFRLGNEYLAALFVDIGSAPAEGKVYGGGVTIKANKLTAEQSEGGWRLGASSSGDGSYRDHWFTYASYSEQAEDWVEVSATWLPLLAAQLRELLVVQAAAWWNGESAAPTGLSVEQTIDKARRLNADNAASNSRRVRDAGA